MGKTKDIREAVEAELDFDPLVDAADITVKNASGQVALNGTVPSYPQYLEAAAAAQRVAGVEQHQVELAHGGRGRLLGADGRNLGAQAIGSRQR